MTKKKSAVRSALSQTVPHTQWTRARESERVIYEQHEKDAKPAGWQARGPYTGGELSYRGQQERRPIVSLAGRPL